MPLIKILTTIQIIGGSILIIGLNKLDLSFTFCGTIVVYLTKILFLDRMVWVFEDMKMIMNTSTCYINLNVLLHK